MNIETQGPLMLISVAPQAQAALTCMIGFLGLLMA